MIGYPKRWIGSTDKEIESGTGFFTIGGVEHRIQLENFRQYMELDEMLETAFRLGEEFAGKTIASRVMSVLSDSVRDV